MFDARWARGQADFGRPEMHGATGRHNLSTWGQRSGRLLIDQCRPGKYGGDWDERGTRGQVGVVRAGGGPRVGQGKWTLPPSDHHASNHPAILTSLHRRRARRLLIRTHVLLWHQTLAVRRIARGQVEFYNACIELCRPEFLVVEDDELSSGGAPRWIRRWIRRRRVDVGYSGIELGALTAASSFAV